MEDLITQLKKQVADLEARQQLLIDVVAAMLGDARPEGASFPLFAIAHSFTAAELDALNQFYGWAMKHQASQLFTRDQVQAQFAALLPSRKQMLEPIMQAHLADKRFRALVKLMLGVDFDE